MKIEVKKLTAESKSDFYKVNCESNGLGWCNCVAWWCKTWDEFKDRTEAQNRKQREDLFASGEFDGYVLYADGVAAGWSQVGARDRLAKLCSQYNLKPLPDTYAISCFSIAPAHRGKALSHVFIKEILQDLKSKGIRHVQGFPKRKTDDPWTGPESVFVKAGFKLEKDAPNLPIYGISMEKMMKIELKKLDYIMVMVENMNRSIEFYRDVLGLPLKFSSDSWTEFNAGTTTLALHGGGKRQPQSATSEPHRDMAGTASIGFNVDDVQATYEFFESKGVKFTLTPTSRQNEGIILAVAVDPDGLDISFAQQVRKT